MKNTLLNSRWLSIMAIALLIQVISCKTDDPAPEVISSFTFVVDAADFKKLTFTNTSQNYSTSSWDFGDASAKSTDTNPVHIFPAAGDYNVALTVTNADGKTKDVKTVKVTVSDPNALLTAIAGTTSKTWKMLRQTDMAGGKGAFPLTVGELQGAAGSETIKGIWWRFGKDEDLAKRPCFLNDEFKFTRAGLVFNRDLKGDFYAGDGGIYKSKGDGGPEFSCQNVGAPNTNTSKDGADITAWHAPFTGTFVLTPGSTPKVKIVGTGAYIGLEKVATNAEVKVPQADVTYEIEKLYDAPNGTDTLKLMVKYNFDSDAEMDAYWRFVLVAYDNSANEPVLPGPKPTASFTATLSGSTLTTTNTTTDGVSYLWDFGDGGTSTAASPTHTYTADGIYNVTVKATNPNGDNTSGAQMFVVNSANLTLSDAVLQGLPWRVRADVNSVFVGPGFGKNDWYVVPKADLTAGGSWVCMTNDEFKFSTGGVFGYDTKGDVRNDGYMAGFDNGCLTDAQLATVTNDGKLFKTEAAHSYVLTPASGATRAKITVTNGGANNAIAFLGFYKPYNGGENSDKTKAANGGKTSTTYEVMAYVKNTSTNKEYLFITIDYTASQDGSQAWSVVLVR